jgi:hypothetical protein
MHQNYFGPYKFGMQAQEQGHHSSKNLQSINKALEQKLIGPLEESHTEEQSPKIVLQMELCTRR